MLVRRFTCPTIGLALLVVVFLGGAGAADATMLGFGQPLAISAASQPPGPAAAPVSANELANALRQQTGLKPSQVSAENACPDAASGHVTCDAQVLVLRSTHALVHPSTPKAKASAQTTTAGGATPATEPAGAAAPPAHTPAFLQQAYDLSWLASQNGATDTVAIVDAGDDATAESDLGTFRSNFGLTPCTTANGCFTEVNQSGQTSPTPPPAGWEMEISLDLDAVSSLCPKCHILLVEANTNAWSDMDTAVQTAAAMGAKQISMSFSGTGSGGPGGQWTFPSVSSLAATGDHGYPGAGENNYPAAYASVTAVGGTSLTAAGTARGYAESAWSLSNGWGGGSGCDTTQAKPAYQHDTGCTGRSYSDVSADADINTGLDVYDTTDGGWLLVGGTSLATPLVAAYEAVSGISDPTSQWPYTNTAVLNDVISGSTGSCAGSISYICDAQTGYDGPTGEGSISGAVAGGAPGIGGSYTSSPAQAGAATLNGGVYPNALDTTYRWEWGTTTSYGNQTQTVDAGAGSGLVPSSTLLPNLQPNTTYHYRLVATNADGTTYGYDNAFTTPSGNPPRQILAPSVSGTPQPGQTLTVNPGTWSPGGTATYQWQFEASGASTFSNLAGATSAGYVPDASQLGGQLQAIVTVTNSDGVSTATASAGTVEPPTAPVNTTPPSISGAAHDGATLTANPGAWAPSGTVAYQWQEASSAAGPYVAVPGANTSQYSLTSADVNQYLRVEVTETDSVGATSADSAAVGPVLIAPPANTAAPTISGTAKQGQTLNAQPGSWSGASPGAGPSYAWQRYIGGWQNIPGATASSYTLAAADAATSVRVVVTESNGTGPTSAASASSGPVAALAPPVDLSPPVIGGSARIGQTLSGGGGIWNPSGTVSYQWLRCPAGATGLGDGCAAVGADAGTYALSDADAGGYIRLSVTEVNTDGAASATSAAIGPVGSFAAAIPPTASAAAGPPPIVVTPPSLTGRPVLGARIGLAPGRYGGGTLQSVQFYRCARQCVAVSAPGGSAYTLTTADEGQYIRAQVRVSGAGGTMTAWSANLLGPVIGPLAGAAHLAVSARAASAPRGGSVRAGGRMLLAARTSRFGRSVKLSLITAPEKKAAVTVRVYVLRAGAIVSCTSPRTVRGRLQLTLALGLGETVQVTAVKRAHG